MRAKGFPPWKVRKALADRPKQPVRQRKTVNVTHSNRRLGTITNADKTKVLTFEHGNTYRWEAAVEFSTDDKRTWTRAASVQTLMDDPKLMGTIWVRPAA